MQRQLRVCRSACAPLISMLLLKRFKARVTSWPANTGELRVVAHQLPPVKC